MLVFYDTETTGTNVVFDQILQFAAILTDDLLQEIDRFEVRCQILPWIVPSPVALLVTNTSPTQLNDLLLPTFFEMMALIRDRLEAWSPTTFVGYNSIRFDEPFLQRAFWQTLNPPYLTVTNGNARSDLLPLVQAASHLAPNTLAWPESENGGISFKLDQIAPLNGFDHSNAHDALGDVEASIFLAQQLAKRAPDLWSIVMSRASKSATASVLSLAKPVLIVEHFRGGPSVWFGQRIDRNGERTTAATVARLAYDWRSTADRGNEALEDALHKTQKVLRQIPLNKSPIVLTLEEATASFGKTLTDKENTQSNFLSENTEFAAQIVSTFEAQSEPWPEPKELEQMIYDSFPSREDEARMERFQQATWRERAQIIRSFDDRRFCHLGLRIMYVSAPDQIQFSDLNRIESAISYRLHAGTQPTHPWRSIADALHELSRIDSASDSNNEHLIEIEDWLKNKETNI